MAQEILRITVPASDKRRLRMMKVDEAAGTGKTNPVALDDNGVKQWRTLAIRSDVAITALKLQISGRVVAADYPPIVDANEWSPMQSPWMTNDKEFQFVTTHANSAVEYEIVTEVEES